MVKSNPPWQGVGKVGPQDWSPCRHEGIVRLGDSRNDHKETGMMRSNQLCGPRYEIDDKTEMRGLAHGHTSDSSQD
jgi:hypothetical protein